MNKEEVTKQMQTLIDQLNAASDSYYNGSDELMSNKEWDAMFDQLTNLEKESGIVLPNSPTQNVGAVVTETIKGAKVKHEFPALSLAKSKDINSHIQWADHRKCFESWKLDGMTLVLSYDNGELTRIATRGDGYAGTDITHH